MVLCSSCGDGDTRVVEDVRLVVCVRKHTEGAELSFNQPTL